MARLPYCASPQEGHPWLDELRTALVVMGVGDETVYRDAQWHTSCVASRDRAIDRGNPRVIRCASVLTLALTPLV